MEYNTFQFISQNSSGLNSGSYLSPTEYSLFITSSSVPDLWYGMSAHDVIELGVFDKSKNLLFWDRLNVEKQYSQKIYSYLDEVDLPVTYSYSDLLDGFTLFKNEKILISPPEQLSSSFGILSGSFSLSYNFTREIAGTFEDPLVIKEVSNSRKELKLSTAKKDTSEYVAFCQKKFIIRDVSPLYIQLISQCPYGKIFNEISSQYIGEINLLKTIFFLDDDGEVLLFFKNLYEDYITYTNKTEDTLGILTNDSQKITRIQGIRTSFQNYLMSNIDTISSFENLDSNYYSFVNTRIDKKFSQLGEIVVKQYKDCIQFVKNFFTIHFYDIISKNLKNKFIEKYFSPLRNALNFGEGILLPILNHHYINEEDGSLTLLIKLKDPLPNNYAKLSQCWISNISLVPYLINVSLKPILETPTIKIGVPNFSVDIPNISLYKLNQSYTAEDLKNNDTTEREISISKKINELSIDYTLFNNFIVFSSAELRLNIFKNKMISISSLTGSLIELENKNTNFISTSGSVYPYYTEEASDLSTKINNVINSFDGYEAYLYRSGNYQYLSGSFVSSSYVSEMDVSASFYDRYNRDSLVNNTPQHILLDENNGDYVIFLSMVGHYFDEIYSYISSLPSEREINQKSSETFSRTLIDNMLSMFGWKLDDILDTSNVLNTYLSSDEVSGLYSLSAEERTKIIRNRILLNLPQIYKTKGTAEAIKMLLSCYGIPSTLLDVVEYGGVNYGIETTTYTKYERAYMYQWNTSSIYDHFRTSYPSKVKTIEYKFSIPNATDYPYNVEQIQWGTIDGAVSSTSDSGSGYIHGGFVRERTNGLGKIFFTVGFRNHELFTLYSNPIPIFDGNIYSVMVRRNSVDSNFDSTTNINEVPTKYELYVQRNENGRPVIQSTSSYINYDILANEWFDKNGYLMIGGWFANYNGQGYNGTLDKFMLWLDPISDLDFNDHVNNINSYAYSGSREGYKSLLLRMHTDYPFDLNQFEPGTSGYFISDSTNWWGIWKNASGYYSDPNTLLTRYENESTTTIGISNFYEIASWAAWSGSQELVYNTSSCQYVSQSIYPYQFKEIDYPCVYTVSKYGPNKFRNEKTKYISQSIEARFDTISTSTYTPSAFTTPDSNLMGIVADPQIFKNKDIIRTFGNFDIMDQIGDPSFAFSSSYDALNKLRNQYIAPKLMTSGSTPRINEMLTLYKLYFNNSIFETMRNLIPARTNAILGVTIEPTILERPKYERKKIQNEFNTGSVYYFDVTASRYYSDPNTKLARLTESIEHGETNFDTSSVLTSFDLSSLPTNYYLNVNVSHINYTSFNYPINYGHKLELVNDVEDLYQLSHFGEWEQDYGKIPYDMNVFDHPSQSLESRLLKQWNKVTIYYKSGSWNKTDSPSENLYITNSIYLYKYICVSEDFFNTIVHTEQVENSNLSPLPSMDNSKFIHLPNTFKNTPNEKVNNISANSVFTGIRYLLDENTYYVREEPAFFEIIRGYPRNHYFHKIQTFSPIKTITYSGFNNLISGSYIRSQQTYQTTIGDDGLEDGSFPIQKFDVSNVKLIQSENVINQ